MTTLLEENAQKCTSGRSRPRRIPFDGTVDIAAFEACCSVHFHNWHDAMHEPLHQSRDDTLQIWRELCNAVYRLSIYDFSLAVDAKERLHWTLIWHWVAQMGSMFHTTRGMPGYATYGTVEQASSFLRDLHVWHVSRLYRPYARALEVQEWNLFLFWYCIHQINH